MPVGDALRSLFTRAPAPDRLDDPALTTSVTLPRGPHRQQAAVVTASAARVVPGNAGAVRSSRQKWQADAWVYRDAVPEVRYAHNFLGNASAQVVMFAAELGNDGEEPIDFDSEECTLPAPLIEACRAAMDRLTGSAAGHGVILSPVVQNFETVGECYLVGYTDPDTSRENWSIRSMDELRITDSGYQLVDSVANSQQGKDLPPDTYVARLWSPHPRFSSWADSPMRALLDVCEELLLAGRSRRAALRSRIAGNGILKVPNEIITGTDATTTEPENGYATAEGVTDDSDVKATKFMADLTAAMVTPIGDEGAASSVVPMLVRGDAEALKALEHLSLARPMSKDVDETEDRAIRRIGTGLDIPPEILAGMAKVNHWTAWAIDTATWTHHVEPIVAAACAALTIGYLRATLLTMGFTWAVVSRVVVWYDPDNLLANPRENEEVGETGRTPEELSSLFTTAQVAIDAGFDPAEVLAALDLPELTYIGPPATPPGNGAAPVQVPSTRVPVEGPPPGEDDPAEPEPAPTPSAVKAAAALHRLGLLGRRPVTAAATAPPTPQQVRLSRRLMDIDRALRERLVGACDAAMARVLERAGNRVRSAAVKASGYRDQVAGVPGQEVPARLGRAVVAALGLDEAELLSDEYTRLRGQYTEWTAAATQDAISTAVRLAGADTNTETIRRLVGELERAYAANIDAGWEFLQTGLQDVAETHLYRPNPDAVEVGEVAESLVNPSLVRGALATAGGLHTAIGGLTRDGLPGSQNRGVGGIGTGELLSDFMRGQGQEVDHYEWAYGISSRIFHPHLSLDGVVFSDFGAPELSTAGTGGEWVGSSFAPGDHKGCHCDYLPVWADGVRQRDVLTEVGDVAGGRATDLASDRPVIEGPRRRTVAPSAAYTGHDKPPAAPVGKPRTKQTATQRKAAHDEGGVPYRLTYGYLSKLNTEQLDHLVEHMSARLDSLDPRELKRWEAFEQWETYEAGETAALEAAASEFDAEPDMVRMRQVAEEFARSNAVPGLTHNRVGGRPHTEGWFTTGERSTATRVELQEQYSLWVEDNWTAAESACRGVTVNAAGQARGWSTSSLLTARVEDVARYASPEFLEWLETHPRMSWSEFYYAQTGNPAFAERAAKHARENASISRDSATKPRGAPK